MSVRVEDPGHFIGVDLVNLVLDGFNKAFVFDDRIHCYLPLGLYGATGIYSYYRLDPLLELGHFLP